MEGRPIAPLFSADLTPRCGEVLLEVFVFSPPPGEPLLEVAKKRHHRHHHSPPAITRHPPLLSRPSRRRVHVQGYALLLGLPAVAGQLRLDVVLTVVDEEKRERETQEDASQVLKAVRRAQEISKAK